jgi:acyl carrier protein
MLKDDQIWSVDTIDETPGESNESSRDFRIDAGPEWDSMASIDVVMKLRDDKGATHWLAARHQGIAGVE